MGKKRKQFEAFTKNYLTKPNQDRWNSLYRLGKKHWSKIDVWKLWEDEFCKKSVNKYEWLKSTAELAEFIKPFAEKEDILVIGLGHNFPFESDVTFQELKENFFKLLEGLILIGNHPFAIAINHDGNVMIFDK